MLSYKVNLDYESSLFDEHYQEDAASSSRAIKEFEYIFFLVNQENVVLKNAKSYSLEYLNHLKRLGFLIPQLDPKVHGALNWWGARQNLELEKKLNSKLTSASMAGLHQWGFFKGKIVSSRQEIKSHLLTYPEVIRWIIKHPHSFSGIGHFIFDAHSIDYIKLEDFLKGESLLEPFYERVFDIGTTFVIEEGNIVKQFMVENFNSQKGAFRGGLGCSDGDKFKKYIFSKYQFDLSKLEDTTREIAESYVALGATSNVQIDSFIYRSQGELKCYPLVEVNYRKTMGLVIQALAEKFSQADAVSWILLTKKEVTQTDLPSDWLRLSPPENHFQSFAQLQYFS